MKKGNWFWLLVIVLTVAVFLGYCSLDAMRTDTKAPEIRMDTDLIEVSVADDKSALLRGLTAEDNRDGNVTDSLVVESVTMLESSGTVSVSYAAFDAAGNVARAERKAVYTDYVSPRFTLSKPLVYVQGTNFDILSHIGATDVFDGDIQHRVRATVLGEETINTAGTHVVQFQVTNSLGDTQTENFPVEVTSGDFYDAEMELEQYIVYLPAGTPFNAAGYLKSFTYQRSNVELSGVVPAGFDLETKGVVQTQNPGVYTVSYTLTYTQVNENNTANSREYTAYSKLIVVVE